MYMCVCMYLMCTHMYTRIYCASVHNGYMRYMNTYYHLTINVNEHNVGNTYYINIIHYRFIVIT